MRKNIVFLIPAVLIIAAATYIIFLEQKDTHQAQSQVMTDIYWPADSWRTSSPEEQGMDSAVLADMVQAIKESNKNINSITIIRNGYLVNETYFYPYQKGYMHSLNSCTKSLVSALVGIAIDEGKIASVDENILKYFPDLSINNLDQLKKDMTIQNLLTMTTGFEWEISNNLSTNQMLQSQNWTEFTLDLPMREEPGLHFNYCNGAANIMSSIIQKSMNKNLAELASEKLKLLRFKDLYWSSNPENISTGYSGIAMYPEDAARFGYLYLKNGNWNGVQLISEKWIKESTKIKIDANWTPRLPGYGYMWWINSFGGYSALGHGGNYIFVIPESDLVVVFTGGLFSIDDLFYPTELMENYIVPSVRSNEPLELNAESAESLKIISQLVQNVPEPESVKPMPELAGKISGKPFILEDSSVFTLTFKEGSNGCALRQDGQYDFPIGLDGVYRVTDIGNLFGGSDVPNHRAMKGSWMDEKTFQIIAQDLEEGFVTTYILQLDNDQVLAKVKSNLDYEQILSGKFME